MQTTRYLAEAARGDPRALENLAHRLRPLMVAMARQKLPPGLRSTYQEEDLIQDVWVVVLRNLGALRARHGRRTPVLVRYVRSTMERRVVTVLRREIYRTVKSLPLAGTGLGELEHPDRRAISVVAARELSAEIADRIDALPEPTRSIVYQRAVEQRPNHEVASRLGMRPNTVAKVYQRALVELRKRWPASVFAEL